jgi:hypothetical protein
MTQEDKELLLKDISARLPYGVKCAEVYPDGNKFENEWDIIRISKYVEDGVHISNCKTTYGYCSQIQNIKPYLFPMSSMSEELREEHKDLLDIQYSFDANDNVFTLQDFYCKYHIDYRCLIPMGLAIDATNKNIY